MEQHSSASQTSWEARAAAALSFFGEKTDKSGLRPAIDDAIERGRKRRRCKDVNILVHPEFAWHPRTALHNDILPEDVALVERATARYAERITSVLHDDPHSVVVAYPDARKHYRDFPYDDDLAIVTPPFGSARVMQGMLDRAGIATLLGRLDGIRETDRIRIHGAAWNRCPKALARQLIGIATFGVYMPPYVREEGEGALIAEHTETLLTLLYNVEHVRKKTRIRLGIQHNSQNIPIPDSLCRDLSEHGVTKLYPRKTFRPKNIATV